MKIEVIDSPTGVKMVVNDKPFELLNEYFGTIDTCNLINAILEIIPSAEINMIIKQDL